MISQNTNPALKILFMVAGLTTFIVGLMVASRFSSGFGRKVVPIVLLFIAIAFIVHKFKKKDCCG